MIIFVVYRRLCKYIIKSISTQTSPPNVTIFNLGLPSGLSRHQLCKLAENIGEKIRNYLHARQCIASRVYLFLSTYRLGTRQDLWRMRSENGVKRNTYKIMKKGLVQETKLRDKACVRTKKSCHCGLEMTQNFHFSNQHETLLFNPTF